MLINYSEDYKMDDETLKLYGYVISSSYRERSVRVLYEGEMTPTMIANKAGIKINHISKVLKELKEKKIAICINEKNRKNRIYSLTKTGEKIADYINKQSSR